MPPPRWDGRGTVPISSNLGCCPWGSCTVHTELIQVGGWHRQVRYSVPVLARGQGASREEAADCQPETSQYPVLRITGRLHKGRWGSNRETDVKRDEQVGEDLGLGVRGSRGSEVILGHPRPSPRAGPYAPDPRAGLCPPDWAPGQGCVRQTPEQGCVPQTLEQSHVPPDQTPGQSHDPQTRPRTEPCSPDETPGQGHVPQTRPQSRAVSPGLGPGAGLCPPDGTLGQNHDPQTRSQGRAVSPRPQNRAMCPRPDPRARPCPARLDPRAGPCPPD